MASLFSKPKIPAPEAPKPLPREDDEATRRARLKQFAKIAEGGGRESNRLMGGGEQKLGDYQSEPAATRGATVLGG